MNANNTLIVGLNAANVAYIKRHPTDAVLNANGVQDDIARAIKNATAMTDSQLTTIKSLVNIDACCKLIGESTNVKKALRAIDLLMLLTTDNMTYCRASTRVFMLTYANQITGNIKTADGMLFTACGKGGDEHTSDQLRSLPNARRLLQAIGATGITSYMTQRSVAWSKGGLGDIVGAIDFGSGARGKLPTLRSDAPIMQAVNAWFAKLTEGKIDLLAQAAKQSAKGAK